MNNFINNVNNQQMMKVMAEMVFKNFIEDIKASAPQNTILYRQIENTGQINKEDGYTFVIASDQKALCGKIKSSSN